MTAPQRRRPLPALAFIGALCLLTALVWFRVIHRSDSASGSNPRTCTSSSPPAPAPASKVVPAPGTVSVLVLNASQRDGLAGRTKKALESRHFTVTRATNDAAAYGGHGRLAGVGEIRYGPSATAAATLLHFYLPGAAVQKTDASSAVVTVAVGARFRSLASPAAVQRAMARHHYHYGVVRTATKPTPTCQPSATPTG